MRLALYSSVAGRAFPNLVALQDESLSALPTILVCPLKAQIALTDVRLEISWGDESFIACPELTRPIRRAGLHPKGLLDSENSREIMARFLLLLAR